MKINLATKRDINGNRKIILIDTEKREYARASSRWYCREDFIECSLSDVRKAEEKAIQEGYKRLDNMTP